MYRALLVVGLVLVAGIGPAEASLRAHFTASQINSGCWTVNADPPFGDPDRYFRMAVFDSSASTVLNACSVGCVADSSGSTLDGETADQCAANTGCGVWNFTDRTITKVIPNNSGAYFYFGLWDEDTDADDSLGDHWFYASGPSGGTVNNNNQSAYYADNPIAAICGRDVESQGAANNFSLTYSIWFDDTTAPAPPSFVLHMDDEIATDWNDDTILQLTWGEGSDPNSGIQGHFFGLYDETHGAWIFQDEPAPGDGDLTICSSGCDFAFTPVHGTEYRFDIAARNGFYPAISNPATSPPASVEFGTDLVDPVSAITAPAAGAWQAGGFTVGVSDSDSGSGLEGCLWRARSSGQTTVSETLRACGESIPVSVGPGMICRHEGDSVCAIEVWSVDVAGRGSVLHQRTYSVDLAADMIQSILARTSATGSSIAEDSWTTDSDPYMEVVAAASASPITGFSWAVDTAPDCTPDTAGGSSLALQLPPQADGSHDFNVLALDEAGHCGPASSFSFGIDTQAEAILGIQATGAGGGPQLFDGVWHPFTSVDMSWTAETGDAPPAGYSWSTLGTPDCAPDLPDATLGLTGLSEGTTLFRVRALDQAGNCGATLVFSLAVDSQSELVTGIIAFDEPAGMQIPAGQWQSDNDPFLTWDLPSSISPIAGYAWSVDAAPSCDPTLADPEAQLPVLAEGTHTFFVQAIDEAGNCGSSSSFDLAVDSVGDHVLQLQLLTEPGGSTIQPAAWQTDSDPYATWAVPASTSPVIGYSWSVDEPAPCEAMLVDPEFQFPTLNDGMHVLYVRAIDAAGNCGSATSFPLWIDSLAGTGPGRILGDLTLSPAVLPGDLVLTWGASCVAAQDYSVHEGAFGDWYTHFARTCSTSGALSATITPDSGDRYFLVVPLSVSEEGSYGYHSGGADRPASIPFCLPQAASVTCP